MPEIIVKTDYGEEVLSLKLDRAELETDHDKVDKAMGTVTFYTGVACTRERFYYEVENEGR
jgi:hypothetical protein